MMKQPLLLLALFLMFFSGFSQTNGTYNTEKVWRFNFLLPGAELELPLSNNTTFSINPELGFAFGFSASSNTETEFSYALLPQLDLKYRWYYNFEKRKEKGLTTLNNSANFLAFRAVTGFPSIAEQNFEDANELIQGFHVMWGLQRSFNSFQLMFATGPGVLLGFDGNADFSLAIELNMGFDL